jgi:hypothetical protein
MKRYILSFSLIMFVMAAVMLVTNFFRPCSPGRGTGLYCSISSGMVAHIDSPAKISIYHHNPYTVGIVDSNGVIQAQTSLSIDGRSEMDFLSPGPVDIYMLKSDGGVSIPIISVYTIDGQSYPSLTVTRSALSPLTQLVQWYLFPPFLYSLMVGVILLVGSVRMK